MKLLLLQRFNNYFNRTISLYSTTADYISHASSSKVYTDMNFNPNDGIRTTHIIGKGRDENFNINQCDYLVCYNIDGETENIVSRWYIIEAVRTRANQYELTLKRDTIADNFNTLLSCPAYIKKGTVDDSNPLIVNNEGVRVNQIKQSETLLKDATGSSWIVGYMAKNAPATAISVQIPDDVDIPHETIEDIASTFGISIADLDAALTEATDNPSYFVNDNIELVGWLNIPNYQESENRVIAGSQNFLNSFTYSSESVKNHKNVNDCLAIWHNYFTTQGGTQVTKYIKNYWLEAVQHYQTSIKTNWENYTGHPLFTRPLYNRLMQMQNNNIYILKQSKYYRIRVSSSTGPTNTGELYAVDQSNATMSSIINRMITRWETDYPNYQLDLRSGGKVFINYNEMVVNFYLEEVTDFSDIPGINISMSTTRNAILDQPYDMFAIPASNTQIESGADTYDVIGEYAQKTAMALVKELTSANVYDVQLLPYCPIPELAHNGKINIGNLTASKDYDFIYQTGTTASGSQDEWGSLNEYAPGQYEAEFFVDTGVPSADFISKSFIILQNDSMTPNIQLNSSTSIVNNQVRILVYGQVNDDRDPDHIQIRIMWTYTSHDPVVKSIIIYPKSNSFSTNLNYNLELQDSMKVDSNCDMYRLVSPNYQGTFEFNVANNGGSVNGFIAECTYKPYTPYIKVAPNFSWLYGMNHGDCRGLICGGDFSIGIISDKWQEYQLQNKNYQNIFNREIQNLDFQRGIAREQQGWQVAAGTVQSGLSGAASGFIASGNGYVAAATGVAAAAASLGGGLADINVMEKQMQENRQLSIDKFRMQIGNIQALPYTLTKVGAFDINSKIWPFLEYYTCTEQEKEAFKMKIQYEGMTVGIVDVLGNYISNPGYLQADLIRNTDIIEDSHTVDDIYVELTKGVYL